MQYTARIIIIDMHIRDERVLNYLVQECKAGAKQLSHEEIAAHFSCHRHTAAAIVWRLELAGHINIEKTAKRGGYIYRIPTCPVLR